MKKIVKICGIPYEIIDKDFIESCSGRCVGQITYTGAFSGKRIYRGLYKAADGTTINADVNGAANILRKVSGYSFELPGSGCLAHPLRISFS